MLKSQVICRLPGENNGWGKFSSPVKIITAWTAAEVKPALAKIEQATRSGQYAAGFIAYEAAPAFDPAFAVHSAPDAPLLWFGIYDHEPETVSFAAEATPCPALPPSQPKIAENAYHQAIRQIKEHIAAGDIYQANYTIRTHLAKPEVSPEALFFALCGNHPVPYAALVDTGERQLISISPELFLEKQGTAIHSSPMKGTAPRQLSADADRQAATALADDEKNRAENLMIVDMVRNDLGRICRSGSISATPLFQVDTYRTVHQMVSTVRGELPDDVHLTDIFTAAFPAASITGAPKIRAMAIINKTETSPRHAYTGSIGCIMPNGDFCFNVAIRTLINSPEGMELSVGGGIVADSQPESEWQEALLKSSFASLSPLPEFQILETMLYTADGGLFMLDEHLDRAAKSQYYFNRPFDRKRIAAHLKELTIDTHRARVRLTIDADGTPETTVFTLIKPGWGKDLISIAIAPETVNRDNVFLYHKTTRRDMYDRLYHQALELGLDELVFFNKKGELTEGCISNIFIRRDGLWLTPQLSCGLLPGLWRARTIAELNATEAILKLDDLMNADIVMMGNSVRGSTFTELSDK